MASAGTAFRPAPEVIASLRDWPIVAAEHARTMPATWYLHPDVFELERQSVLADTWHMVATVAQLQDPGDYVATDVLGERIVLIRGRDGVLRALSNVCSHRAAPLVAGVGRCSALQCTYHGWVYGLDGKLKSCRGMEGAVGFDRDKAGLHEFPVATWSHWVYVSTGSPPPFDEFIGPSDERGANYELDRLQLAGTRTWEVPVNWKVLNDGNSEGYHVPFLHPTLNRAYNSGETFGMGDLVDDGDEDQEPAGYVQFASAYTGEMRTDEPVDTGPFSKAVGPLGGTRDYRVAKQILGSLEGRERDAHYFMFNFPGLTHLHFLPDGLLVIRIVALAHDWTRLILDWWLPPSTSIEQRILQAALVSYGNGVLEEDIAMGAAVWDGLQSSYYEDGRFAPDEEFLLHTFVTWYARRMLMCLDMLEVQP